MTDPMRAEPALLLAVDQGTSATKSILVDRSGAVVAKATVPISQAHPRPGWAEQDAQEIWASIQNAVSECLAGQDSRYVAGLGLSTQRESTLLWERATGRPLGPVLSWQDGRGAETCDRLRQHGHAERVHAVSGLPLDPMFSASKMAWLLDSHDPDRSRSLRGELCLGTIDSWLLWRLTASEHASGNARHLIEVGNASRTSLLNLDDRTWDPWLLERFRVPMSALPKVIASNGPFPTTHALTALPHGVRIGAVLGDSHAALFAHAGWQPGLVKATYGTGSSVMGLAADPNTAPPTLARTIAWETDRPYYALEGNIRSTGATLKWLANLLSSTPADIAQTAAETSDGVVLVPAFTGLGAPWWDDAATAIISGLSYSTGPAQLARAALESIAFQVEDVIAEVERVVGRIDVVLADGGPTGNAALIQLQADTSGRTVERSLTPDLSALGAAHLAGHTLGVWTSQELDALPRERESYYPKDAPHVRLERVARWLHEIKRSRINYNQTLSDEEQK